MVVHIIKYEHIDDKDAGLTLTFTDRVVAKKVTGLMKFEGFAVSDWEERKVTEFADQLSIKELCAAEMKSAEQYRHDEAAANS